MKLHWSPRSPFVRKVMIAAIELGVESRIELVRSVAITVSPNATLMADSPLNKIPCLVMDDGVPLYDSPVIIEYLNDLAKGSLIPPPGPARWTALRRQALADGLLDLLVAWRGERNRAPEMRSQPHLDAYRHKAEHTLNVMEAEADALGRDSLDVGDIAYGCAAAYVDFRFADLDWARTRPRLDAWRQGFDARPSALKTVIVDDESAPMAAPKTGAQA